MTQQILEIGLRLLMEYLPLIMASIAALLLPRLRAWLNANSHKAGIQLLDQAIIAAVAAVDQQLVQPKKQSGAKLTAEEGATAKKLAIETVKSQLGVKGVKNVESAIKAKLEDTLIGDRIEAAVSDRKIVKK